MLYTKETFILMTSTERREGRYQRRRAKREEKAKKRSKSFDEVYTFESLYKSGLKCCRRVGWKASTQKYHDDIILQTGRTLRALREGKYKSKGFVEFTICDRGKPRDIKAVHIEERAAQKTTNEYEILPIFRPTLIYDCSASIKGKGTDFQLDRVSLFLRRAYRRWGTDFWVVNSDFRKYFENAEHKPIIDAYTKKMSDARMVKQAKYFVDCNGEKGFGLGAELSQSDAAILASPIDHFAKDQRRVKEYCRYNDDWLAFCKTKAEAKDLIEGVRRIAERLGIILHPNKTKVTHIKHGFKFLKVEFTLTKTGKVFRKMPKQSFYTMRRRLRKFKEWIVNGRQVTRNGKTKDVRFTLFDAKQSYMSWRGHILRGNSFKVVRKADKYFMKLFGIHPKQKVRVLCI